MNTDGFDCASQYKCKLSSIKYKVQVKTCEKIEKRQKYMPYKSSIPGGHITPKMHVMYSSKWVNMDKQIKR